MVAAVKGAVSLAQAWRKFDVVDLAATGQRLYLMNITVEKDEANENPRYRADLIDAESGEKIGYMETARIYLARILFEIAGNVPADTPIGPVRFIQYKKTYSIEAA